MVLIVMSVQIVGSRRILHAYYSIFFEVGEDLAYSFIDGECAGLYDKFIVMRDAGYLLTYSSKCHKSSSESTILL